MARYDLTEDADREALAVGDAVALPTAHGSRLVRRDDDASDAYEPGGPKWWAMQQGQAS